MLLNVKQLLIDAERKLKENAVREAQGRGEKNRSVRVRNEKNKGEVKQEIGKPG